MSKGKGGLLIWILLLVVFIVIGFVLSSKIGNFITHERTIDVNVLSGEVKSINELATLKYDYRSVIEKEKSGLLSNSFIATFDGTIKAGVDMDKLEFDVDNPEEDGNPVVVKISIPEAEILSHEDSNPETIYQSGYKSKGLGAERNQAIKDKKKEVEKEFVADGQLDKV